MFRQSIFPVLFVLILGFQKAHGRSGSDSPFLLPSLSNSNQLGTPTPLKKNLNLYGYRFSIEVSAGFYPWRWVYVGANANLSPMSALASVSSPELDTKTIAGNANIREPKKLAVTSGGLQIGIPVRSWIPYGEIGCGFFKNFGGQKLHTQEDSTSFSSPQNFSGKTKIIFGGGVKYVPNRNLALDFSYRRGSPFSKENGESKTPRGHVFQLGVFYKWPLSPLNLKSPEKRHHFSGSEAQKKPLREDLAP